jgi:DNA-binding CsgD family transcriptional regulator
MSSAVPGRFPQPAATVPLRPRWPRGRGAKGARVGLVLLNSSLEPIYGNSEAFSVIAYPAQPAKSADAEFSHSIRTLMGKQLHPDHLPTTTHFVSGRRRYLCRIFGLEPRPSGDSTPTIALTIERDSVPVDLLEHFHLTDREIEVVQHLADGLTSKEIAQRMNVSPNTVKTFMRMVMIRMGVTTRAGVIGKLVRGRAYSRGVD